MIQAIFIENDSAKLETFSKNIGNNIRFSYKKIENVGKLIAVNGNEVTIEITDEVCKKIENLLNKKAFNYLLGFFYLSLFCSIISLINFNTAYFYHNSCNSFLATIFWILGWGYLACIFIGSFMTQEIIKEKKNLK